jgi:hypothetical protein
MSKSMGRVVKQSLNVLRNLHQANTVYQKRTSLRIAAGFRECAARKPHSAA